MTRAWLVTGCGSGFGALLARRVLERGDALVATDRSVDLLEHLDDLAAAAGERLVRTALDVTDAAAARVAVDRTTAAYGRLDVLVNNAGLGLGGPFEELDLADARRVLDVNLVGTMQVTHAALPELRRSRGHLIALSSDSGRVGWPFQNVYNASKHGVEGLLESIALETTAFGVRVSLVEPCGFFATAMPGHALADAEARMRADSPYAPLVAGIVAASHDGLAHATDPAVVVDAILELADADDPPLRRRVGPADRTRIVAMRNAMPDEDYVALLKRLTGGGSCPLDKNAKNQVAGGWLVPRTLAEAGVTHAFGIVGGHNYEVVDGCLDAGIRFVDVRHEQQAVHLADGIARFTRRPALVTVDAAPGLANAVPGLQVAHHAQVPVVVVTAQGSLAGRDLGVMQAIDQHEFLAPVTKWARTCFAAERLPEYTAAAVRHATTGRPGPVLLDFPLELLRDRIDADEIPSPGIRRPTAVPHPDPAAVRAALDVLTNARRPLVVAGSGCWWGDAGDALRALGEATGVPILSRNLARGLVPEDAPYAAGFYPTPAALADAFLVIGTRLDWTIGNGRAPLVDPAAPMVQVDVRPEAIGKARPVDVGIVADAGAFVRSLVREIESYEGRWALDPSWPATAQGTREAMRADARALVADRPADAPIHSVQLVDALREVLPREAITVVDGGYIAAFALQLLDAHEPGGVTWVGSTGHLGVGVAYAMAAALAHPDRPVVALMGDGSFGLCAAELDTAVRHRLPIVVVVANDQGWGEIRDGQRRRFGDERIVGSDLGDVRYADLARSLGAHGERVTALADLEPALARALTAARETGLPALVDVMTDPVQRSTAVNGLPWLVE